MTLETDAPDNSGEFKHFAVPYSLDADQFFSLHCSSCDRAFKVLADAISIADSLSAAFKQIQVEHGIPLSATEANTAGSKQSQLTCPYCRHTDEPANLNTQEFIDHAVRWMNREHVYDLLNQYLRDMGKIFDHNSHGSRGGFISIGWEYKHTLPKPVRPISGPELPDMKRVKLICCDKFIKITDGWGANIFCPYCSLELILQ